MIVMEIVFVMVIFMNVAMVVVDVFVVVVEVVVVVSVVVMMGGQVGDLVVFMGVVFVVVGESLFRG